MTILNPEHRQMLETGSRLTPEAIDARGYRSVTAEEARNYGFMGEQARAGLLFPICPPDGSNGIYQLRPDAPRVIEQKKKGRLPDGTYPNKVFKYEWPKGQEPRVDVPPVCRPMLQDSTKPLFITEGVKKGDALASHLAGLGYCALDFPAGVWGFKSKSQGLLADLDYIVWKDREIYIVFDSDVVTKPEVAQAMARLSKILDRRGAKVSFVPLPGRKGEKIGVDDYFALGATVDDLLHLVEMGKILPLKTGAKGEQGPQSAEYLEALDELGYTFTMDDTTDTVLVNGRAINDVTEAEIKTRMRDHGYREVNVIADAFLAWAGRNRVHPVKEYLSSLEWDGQDHIFKLASFVQDGHEADYGQVYSDVGYTGNTVFYTWLYRWLLGAVGKVLNREQNIMLVLDGPQDIGKSYLVNWLGDVIGQPGQFFVEAPINPDDKDVWVRLMSKFVWEVAELGSTTRRADREALKNFITVKTVTVRKAYGRYDTIKPAMANLVGTVNNEAGFLTDPTGNRRFLSCKIASLDWRYASQVDPGQVWAQAVALYRNGERGRLTADERRLQNVINDGYMIERPIEGLFWKYYEVDRASEVWIPSMDIITHLEGMGLKGSQVQNLKELAAALDGLSVRKKRIRVDGEKTVCYQGIRKRLRPQEE